jgi:parallel beta-helix repeat protein
MQLGQASPNSITYCTFTRNKQYDLIADGVYDFSDPVGLTISNCIDSVGAGSGFWLTAHMKDAVISNNQFIGSGGSGGSVTGLCFDHPGGSSSPLITGNTFTGFSSGQGLKLGGGRAIVRGNTLSNSKYGATIIGGTHEFAPASMGGAAVNTFSNNGYAGAYIVGSGASPIFRQNLFSNNYNGVVSKSGATPNFGTTGSHGSNSVIGSTNKCLWNQSSSSISAVGNYWGIPCPEEGEMPMCIVGATIFPMLCTSPFSARGPLVSVEPIGQDPPIL